MGILIPSGLANVPKVNYEEPGVHTYDLVTLLRCSVGLDQDHIFSWVGNAQKRTGKMGNMIWYLLDNNIALGGYDDGVIFIAGKNGIEIVTSDEYVCKAGISLSKKKYNSFYCTFSNYCNRTV